MGKSEVKGTVTSLSSLFPAEEAKKAAKQVEAKVSEKEKEMNELREFIADNTSLINLVQKLPDQLHHDVMVPFGKAAFFPGRLIHTNEILVLLGESYYTERTAKQTVEILMRRGKSLESKVNGLKAIMQDLKAEASFFDSTASDVAEGLVEIKEYEEDNSTERVSQSGSAELESIAEADNKTGVSEDDEYARIMARLEELEKEELAAEDNNENDEDQDANAAKSVGDEDEMTKAALHRKKDGFGSLDHGQQNTESRKQIEQSKGKEPMNKEMSNEYTHQDLTNQLACTGLTVDPITKGGMSHSRILHQDTKMLNPSINASVPLEKKSVQTKESEFDSSKKSVQTKESEFDSSKAFTGSIVEHAQNLEKILPGQKKTSSQSSGSQPSKPVSRFKMQRK